jgi:hypothetical protein
LIEIDPQQVAAGSSLSFEVRAIDPNESDSLTMTASSLPLNATFTQFASGAGFFSFLPDQSQLGDHTVVFHATDPVGLADSQSVVITVTDSGD